MFKRLKRALDDALSELESRFGPGPEADVDRLLAAMREELVETKARIPELESQLEGLEREKRAEEKRAEDCVRRAGQAAEIGDAETVEVAERFAKKHLARVGVLEQKIESTRSEIAFTEQQAAQMSEQLKSALKRKDAIGIQARRAKAIDDLRGGGDDAFDAFDRAADRIGREDDVDAARRELDEELGGPRRPSLSDLRDPTLEREVRERRAEEMLEELKRRMGTEGEG